MAGTETFTCICGVVVASADELDAFGLCFDCAALEPGQACDCPECTEARERLYVEVVAVVEQLDSRRRTVRRRALSRAA
jgi:hypothetical protein